MERINIEFIAIGFSFFGVLLGSSVPIFFEKKQYWYFEKKELIKMINSIQDVYRELTENPQTKNSQLFVNTINKKMILVANCSLEFRFQKYKLKKVNSNLKIIRDFVLDSEFEEILNLNGETHKKYSSYATKLSGIINTSAKSLLTKKKF